MRTTTTDGTGRRPRSRTAAAAALVGAVVTAVLALPVAASAYSVPQPDDGVVALVPVTAAEKAQALLERRVRQRQKVLVSLTRQAAQYEEVKADEVARLAALGYTGALADLTHVLPVAGYHLSAGFGLTGAHWEHEHTGLDFAAPLGSTLAAVGAGTITSVGDAGPYGLRTILTLEDGTELWYCHQLTTVVEPGDVVEVGQPLGLIGVSGNTTGPHLHLEVRPPGVGPVDPVPWFQALDLTP